jgi:hypothetical protein
VNWPVFWGLAWLAAVVLGAAFLLWLVERALIARERRAVAAAAMCAIHPEHPAVRSKLQREVQR